MHVEPDANDKKQVNVHYVSTAVPCVVEENFEGYYHDNNDFVFAEVLQDQVDFGYDLKPCLLKCRVI